MPSWSSHEITFDPYRRCERDCNHDLVRAVTLQEILGKRDGPALVGRDPWLVLLRAVYGMTT